LHPVAARRIIVVVQTRWHEDDLAGRLSREHPADWDILSQAAIAEADDAFRKTGEALWPEKFPLHVLEQIRAEVGGAAWTSQYQQQPAAAEGAIFKREWWRSFREQPAFTRIVQSWDTAFKTGCDNDFSVCTTWGVSGSNYFLLWLWRGRVEFPELKKRMAWLAQEWKPAQIWSKT
jgi:hypothetical protein